MRMIVFTGVLVVALAACQQQGDESLLEEPDSPVVAEMAGKKFHEHDIDAEMSDLPEHLQYLRNDPRARARVLQALMRRYMLSQKAVEMKLHTDPVIHRRIMRTRDSILIQALEKWKLEHFPAPSAKEIEVYYKKHRKEFSFPEQIHARHILVASEKQARDILRLLRKKSDFAALAATYSLDDSNKTRGGDLNWFPRGIMVKPFEDAAFALKKPGDISKPVKTKYGWHIIQLLGRRPASQKSLKAARVDIIEILRQQALAKWVDGIMKQSGGKIIKSEYRKLPPS